MSDKNYSKCILIGLIVLLCVFAGLLGSQTAANGQDLLPPTAGEKRYQPELIVQTGNSELPGFIAFSPNGKFIASAAGFEIVLWSVSTGKQLRTISLPQNPLASDVFLAFSPDSRILANFTGENVDFRDVHTGKIIKTLKNSSNLDSVVFNSDGSQLITCDSFEINVWEYQSLKKLKTIRSDQSGPPNNLLPKRPLFDSPGNRLVISPDGKLLASFNAFAGSFWAGKRPDGKKSEIRFWSLPDGKELKSHEGIFVAFDPDSNFMALVNKDDVKIVEINTGKEIKTLKGKDLLSFFQTPNPLLFSSDGKTLFFLGQKGELQAWNVKTGEKKELFGGKNQPILTSAISPDGELCAFSGITDVDEYLNTGVSNFTLINVLNVKTGNFERSLQSHISGFKTASFGHFRNLFFEDTRDFGYFVFNTSKGLEVWNTRKGNFSDFFKKLPIGEFNSFDFSPDKRSILLVGGRRPPLPYKIRLFDLENESEIWTNDSNSERIRTAKFSPDGNLIAVSFYTYLKKIGDKILPSRGTEKTISFLDARSGKEVFKLTGFPQMVSSFEFSPNGKLLAVTFKTPLIETSPNIYEDQKATQEEKTIQVWDIKAKRVLREFSFKEDNSWIKKLAFSPDSQILAVSSNSQTRLLDPETGDDLKTIENAGIQNGLDEIMFSPDAKKLAVKHDLPNTLSVFDVETGKELPGSESRSEWIDPLNNIIRIENKRYRVELNGGKMDLVDPEIDKTRISLISLDKTDWAVITPDGLFDASQGAMKAMHFVVSDPDAGYEVIEFEQLKSRYYVPGLYQKIISGEDPGKRGQFTVTLNPGVEVKPDETDPSRLSLLLTNRGGGIGRVEVRVNGGEISADVRGRNFDPDAESAEIPVVIPPEKMRPGENRVEVVAWNKEGDVRSRDVGVVTIKKDGGRKGVSEAPQFYAIVGGVSDYAGDGLDLRFAAKDAEDMAVSLSLGARRLFCAEEMAKEKPCQKVHLTLLSSQKVEKENEVLGRFPGFRRLTPTKANFEAAFSEIGQKAGNQDVFLVYLAGHATAIKSDQAIRESAFADLYLYATSEAVTLDKQRLGNPSERAAMISSLELADWFNQSRAEKKVLILDTCAAGAAQADLTIKLTRNNGDGEQIKALDRLRERTGFYVLMGSASDAVSYEANRFRQGLLTYSLLEAMSGASLREEKFLDIEDWFGYAEDRVEDLARGIGGVQKPRYFKSNYSKRFDVGELGQTERRQIPLTQPVPVILQPRFLDKEKLYDSLNLSDRLAERFRELSYRTERGAEGLEMNYIGAGKLTGGFSPSGLYQVAADGKISVELTIQRDNQQIDRIKVEANSGNDLIEKLVQTIVRSTIKSSEKEN
ncbi:MAG: caspase family protein [Pyrinomonadaceae bacterium]